MPAVALGTAAAAAAAAVAVSASSKAVAATERNASTVAASVPVVVAAVVTDVAGAVSAAAEQARIDAGRRIRSALLPESVFSPSSCRGSRGQQQQQQQQQQQRTAVATTTTTVRGNNNNNNSTAGGGVRSSDGFPQENAPFVSAPTAAAAAAIAGEDIHVGVREALDRWALQTSRRESMVLWRHECSRYASSSRIGYHPNHPSASRPSSRPSSAATVLRPFSTGSAAQQRQQQRQRASSALPPRSLPSSAVDVHTLNAETRGGVAGDEFAASGSAMPMPMPTSGGLLGVSSHARENVGGVDRVQVVEEIGNNNSGGVPAALVPNRRASASETESPGAGGGGGGRGGGGGSGSGSGRPDRRGHDGRNGTRRGEGGTGSSRPPKQEEAQLFSYQEAGELDDDIYEDLDDEDDGELDNRISILENRFSAVGRERPVSAVDGGERSPSSGILDGIVVGTEQRRTARQRTRAIARSARRPSRTSFQPTQQTSAATTTRRLASAEADGGAAAARRTNSTHDAGHPSSSSSSGRVGARALLRRTSSRPTSAPANSSLFYERGVSDPVAALDDRRMRLQMSRAGADAGGYRSAAAREKKGGVGGNVNPRPPVRDVATAVLYWDRDTDGARRPVSCATDGTAADAEENVTAAEKNGRNNRPSSAAFRRWVEARPSVKSAISAVSSARTLGMDDPELLHLQLEMESRRAAMSEAMLARMEDHYEAVVLKNSSPRSRQQAADRTKQERQTLPQTKGGDGVGKNPRVGTASSGSRKGGTSSASGKRGRSRSKGKKKTGKGGAGGKKKAASLPGRGSSKKEKGKAKSRPANAEMVPRRVLPSALAFMAERFPSEERQGVSLLGMEQEEECRHASEALARAGVSISRGALRRALVIPTDRPLEACLAI